VPKDIYSIQLNKTKKFLRESQQFVDTIKSKYDAILQREKEMSDSDGLNYSDEELERNTMLQIQPLLDKQGILLNKYFTGE
tara:strand:+ start:88 stop:330 length:243 start_codon:yes stop_codon:yes gene_type:complete